MQHLFEKLRDDTLKWRKEGYPCPDYPLIGEVLRYQFEGEPREQISLEAKRKAVESLEELQSNARFKCHIIYTDTAFMRENVTEIDTVLAWIHNDETSALT